MKSIVEINKAFKTRKAQEKVILKNTKTLKVFEVNSVVQTLFGAEEKQALMMNLALNPAFWQTACYTKY